MRAIFQSFECPANILSNKHLFWNKIKILPPWIIEPPSSNWQQLAIPVAQVGFCGFFLCCFWE